MLGRMQGFSWTIKKRENFVFQMLPQPANVKMKQCSEYVMLNTPLYQREKSRSCHPAAGVCWTTLLLEETVSLNQETAGKEHRAETERRITEKRSVKQKTCQAPL